jgi:hypothetical protein
MFETWVVAKPPPIFRAQTRLQPDSQKPPPKQSLDGPPSRFILSGFNSLPDQPSLDHSHTLPRNWMILRRSRFDGLPAGNSSNCLIALRSAATFSRSSRLASVSR